MGVEQKLQEKSIPANTDTIKADRQQHSSFMDVTADLRTQFAHEFANPDANAEFIFKDLSFEVNDKSKKKGEGDVPKSNKKQILQNISGSIKAGEILAILGPSGAGKTTLLNMFTLEASDGTGYGSLTLNGTPLKRENFVRNCYYVPQEFSLYAFLTPRETLTYAASLFSKDTQHIERRVNTLLNVMGLESCADTRVGNAFFQGLSGGQKKRLSVAVALLSQPLVLFLDEPTSGLDAAAAAGIMQFLRDLASMANIMIICTIHQPSTDVFYAFDKVMLMANGQLAYLGSADHVVPYFKSIGHNMPQNSNPAEWILDLVNDEFTSPLQVQNILSSWNHHKQQQQQPSVARAPSTRDVSNQDTKNSPGFGSQMWTLIKRHSLLIARDPTLYSGRMILFFIMATFFSIIYIDQRTREQQQVLNKTWLTLWYVGPACSLAVIAVYATNIEFKSVKLEIKNGMVNPLAYILSNTLLQIPLMILITWIAYLIPAYAISNYDAKQLPVFLMLLAVNFLIFEAVAGTMAVQYGNFLVGMLGVMNMWFSAFLFSGMMVKQEDVPWPFRAFMYALPFKYSLQSLLYTEFHDSSFSGATAFDVTDPANANLTANYPRGFYCPPTLSTQQCYGPTGIDALDSLHLNWGVVTSDNNVGRDFGILIGMYFGYKLFFAIMVYARSTTAATLHPPKNVNTPANNDNVENGIKIEDAHDSNMNVMAQDQDRLLRQDDFVREFANPDANAEFVFENVFFEVPDPKNKKNIKQIIKGVTGGVKAGEILTIMGPSGAGKTTLLNALTLEDTTGTSYGSITLNGKPITRELFLQNCFYVPQYPALYAFLTPRETLIITAKLFASQSSNDTDAVIEARVNTLLEVMGLQSCADIKIGNEFFLGLSGGQKKRLSVAVALLSRPLVLFLDEPTTGLDAAAAAGLMKLLQQLATSARILIVATIHQPSDQVFASFDNIMLLARGQTAYQGPAHRVAPYFASIGHPMPATATAAEYMLDLINDEFTSAEKVNSVVAQWKQQDRHANTQASHVTRVIRGASIYQQILLLLKRQSTLVVRDPLLYIGRMIAYLFSNLFFCAVYEAARDRTQSRVVPRMFNDMWCIGTAASMALIIVFGQNRELHTIKTEVKNGMISPLAYLISNTILQLPMLFLMTCVGYLIPFYAVMESNPRYIGEMLCIITAMLWSFEALAELLAVYYSNFLMGMLTFLNFWFTSFLFSGVIASESVVPWPFKLLIYVSPLRYGLETMVYLDFVGDTYGGAVPTLTPTANGKNYMCPGDTSGGAGCFGYNGHEVLSSLHANFDTLDDSNRTLRDILICLLIGFGIKLMYVFLLYKKSTKVSLPRPSDGKISQGVKLSDIKNPEQYITKPITSTDDAKPIVPVTSTNQTIVPVTSNETNSAIAQEQIVVIQRVEPVQGRNHTYSVDSDASAVELSVIPTASAPNRHPSQQVVFHAQL